MQVACEQELAAIINSNSHGIGAALGETGMDCALGIFPALSMLNHSCRPNCNFVSQGTRMRQPGLESEPSYWRRMSCGCLKTTPHRASAMVQALISCPTAVSLPDEAQGQRQQLPRCLVPLMC